MRIDLPDPKAFKQLFYESTGLSLNHTPRGLCIDSRNCQPDDMYIAIKGEQVDGHDFLEQVVEHGSSGALVQRSQDSINTLDQYVVDNPVNMIGTIAEKWYEKFQVPKIGITGTNGKTTTKELLVQILNQTETVHYTQGNYNTSISLPLMLLTMSTSQSISVLEMGASQPGDIKLLAGYSHPTHGLITNVMSAHLEGFGSVEAITKEKGELFNALSKGISFVNQSDPQIKLLEISGHKITYGFERGLDYSARWIQNEKGEWDLNINSKTLNTLSADRALAKNILAAAVIARTLEIEWDLIQSGINSFTPAKGRCQMKSFGTIKVIDDTYNANLASTISAIDLLNTVAENNRKILVIGDMLELGAHSSRDHQAVGEKCNSMNLDYVLCVGEQSKIIDQTINANTRHQHFDSKSDLADELKQIIQPKDSILFKGSRGMALETIINKIFLN